MLQSVARAETSAPHLPALTSLRFCAAAMVFLFHMREFAPSQRLYDLAPGMHHGVSFFFVLSGFVLTHAHADRERRWREFYIARLARIAPLHLFTLALFLAMLPPSVACGQALGLLAALKALALKFAMLDAWAPTRSVLSTWNSVSWSISVEMAFYAAFPLLLPAMLRRPVATLAAAAALSLGTLFAGEAAGLPVYAPARDALSLVHIAACFPPARVFEFALGMASCLVWRRWAAPARLSATAWTAVEAAAIAATAVWLFWAVPPLVWGAQGLAFAWLRPSGSCFVFAGLLIALASGRGWIGRALSLRPFVSLGEASFALYLVHVETMRWLGYRFGGSPGVAATFALALCFAYLLHLGVELPLRQRVLRLGRDDRSLRALNPSLSPAR